MRDSTKVRDNAKVNQLLSGMDENIVNSFSYKQRKALNARLTNQEWGKHKVDFRPTLAIPFFPWSFYFVFLAGVNRRGISQAERIFSCLTLLFVITFIGVLILVSTLLVIYLLKSWLGIDLFPNESIGIWDQVKGAF